MSHNLRSKNNRAADGTPLPGHPAHLNQEDLQILQHMVSEWEAQYPVDVACAQYFAALVMHDMATSGYIVNYTAVTANNVNMLRSLRETKKKEPTLTLTTMLEKAVRVFLKPTKKTTKPPATWI